MFLKNIKSKKIFFCSYTFFFCLILFVGIIVRLLFLSKFPSALNCDEASSGYEAFSILHYGIDRNGNRLPVFLVAWGGGQNALLSYLIIPFISLFGLTFFSIRLPMAILGCISLLVFYFLLKRIANKKMALLGLFFLAICPWHIMKSRWGLESNLFPDLILLFSFLFIKGLEDKNKFLYYFSFVIAGLSAYSYGTSYYFLPVFLFPLLFYSYRKKYITIKQGIFSLGIVGIVSMPIILYVSINTIELSQINLTFMTIPRLEVNRYQEITSIFSSDFFKNSFSNFWNSLVILFTQKDGLPWNSLPIFGTIYLFSLPFTIFGILNSFKKEKKIEVKYEYLFTIWFIVGFVLLFLCEPNINRLNILMIPILYFTVLGLYISLIKIKKYSIFLIAIYTFFFFFFCFVYLKQDFNSYGTFESDLEEVITYVMQFEDKEIHITEKIQSSYMHVLFYTKYNTQKFVDTVIYEDKSAPFKHVLSFGNYFFDVMENIEFQENKIYVIKKEEQSYINIEKFRKEEFSKYIVIFT